MNHVKVFCFVVFSLLWLIPSVAAKDQSAKLLVLGDSLSAAYGLLESEGWVSLLENKWQDEQYAIDIVNAAISGDTTSGGLARLPRLLEQHSPTHIYIELGGNDGLRGQPIKDMKANLASMIALSQEQEVVVILQSMQIPSNYGRRYTDLFTATYNELANEYKVHLVPFFLRDIALDTTLMQKDRIHPNALAQPILTEFMFQKLTPIIAP
jgi:acyl-CoA thioesterase-1